MLYDFSKLDRFMDTLGYPTLETHSGFQIIKGIDFEEAYKAGSISFEYDGIYLEYEGKKYRGYMFIQEAYITYNGGPAKFPKFHVLKCRTIQEFISTGRFRQRYEWSNSDVNNLIDKQTRTRYNDQKLELCSYCRADYLEPIANTVDFFDNLDKSVLEEENIEVDIFGYVKGKEQISKAYRTKKKYTCELCGVICKETMHRRWWHTHHKDGDKTNNKESNLECLCVCCHSQIDDTHQDNFSNDKWQRQIDSFVKLYKEDLIRLGSPCV